jgi:hypothetical protein
MKNKRSQIGLTAGAALSILAVVLLVAASSALAAEPEPPITEAPTSVLATSATFNGELNPGTASETLQYRFNYGRNGRLCTEGREAPEGEKPTATGNHKHVSLPVSGLEANTEYAVCLVAGTGLTVGSSVHFTTPLSAPLVESEGATPVSATEETLRAEVNPENEPATLCVFEYGALTVTEHTAPCEQVIEGGEPETASVALTGLLQATSYHYRVVVKNATGTIDGAEAEFTSALPPETPEPKPASPVTPSTAVLNGVLNPNAAGQPDTYEFIYRESATECQGEGDKSTLAGTSAGELAEPVSAEIRELAFHTQYTFCLLARNDAGETAISGPRTLATLAAAPAINGAYSSNETATAIDLAASINPDGATTAYRIEYGISTSYGTSIPAPPEEVAIGGGDTAVAILQHLTGLSPNTTYHWRIVATNAAGTTDGLDHSFIYATTSSALPDDRAYELVTPAQHNGGLVGWTLYGPRPEIALNGDRVVLASLQCFAEATSCTGTRDNEGSLAAFTRTPSGWTTTALSAPASKFGGSTAWTASAETGKALYSVASAPGGQDDWVSTSISEGTTDIGPATQPSLGPQAYITAGSVESSADLSKLVWTTLSGVAGLRWPGDPSEVDAYEYAGAGNTEPWLIGVSGGPGSKSLISACYTTVGDQDGDGDSNVPGSISADGRTIFFTAEGPDSTNSCPSGSGANAGVPVPANSLYARIDNTEPDAHTVHISERSPAGCTTSECINSAPHAAMTEGASEDGSKAAFTSPQQLTNDSSEGGEIYSDEEPGASGLGRCGSSTGTGCNLYLYDFDRPAGHELTDISAGDTSGGGPRVAGVMAISADGSHIYFVAKGVLTTEPNAQGHAASNGADNLYLYERDATHAAGELTFVATLPNSADENEGNPGAEPRLWRNGPKYANVTPDGRFLIFPSNGQLTAEPDNPAGWAQVFRYDATTRQMIRLSHGADGFNDNGNNAKAGANIVPAQNGDYRIGPARNDPTMADDGTRVFFTSSAALTPHALDNAHATSLGEPLVNNIYEWEQAGVGSCSASEATGCVYLISDGHDAGVIHFTPLRLVGADGTGNNVFIETFDQLAPQDTDEGQLSVYDARVDGGIAPTSEQRCGESCQGTPSNAPALGSPASVAVAGQGNLTPPTTTVIRTKPKPRARSQRLARALHACKKVKPKSRRLKCEAAARKKYGPKPKKSTIKGSK